MCDASFDPYDVRAAVGAPGRIASDVSEMMAMYPTQAEMATIWDRVGPPKWSQDWLAATWLNGLLITYLCVIVRAHRSRALIFECGQGQLFQALRIAFALLRELDDLLGDHVSQWIGALSEAEAAADLLERRRHRVDRRRVEGAILQ